VYERELKRMRRKVKALDYLMTLHAEEEMNDDGYTIRDVERGILSGSIVERQRDVSTGESKFRVRGDSLAGGEIELVTKFSPTGKLVIVTVYEP
jgi:hypothetical protein